jgi:hypothetical protein
MRRTNHRIESILALTAALAATGCSSGPVSLGDGPPDGGQPATVAWTGYIENFHFDSGSDAIAIQITSMSPPLTGTVLLGAGPELPPPSDPDVGYPPGFGQTEQSSANLPYEGFHFTITQGEVSADRIRFHIGQGEIWKDWCALQPPVLIDGSDPPRYDCLQNTSASMTGNTCMAGEEPIDCGKLVICRINHACVCTADSCTARKGRDVSFDLALVTGGAHGSVEGLPSGDLHNVWLTEAE